ncbi:signal recognition particle subunit srp68 [Perkinsus olseni]|uniref:Signal recognition particle subunit SRP68 n=1 Tax=Perkinsus olseni TaxID=32597 RepID=A0A7J6TVN5_PEROL|nr:signal recognition particle subunit srp68 [Perkinsus olseni]
MASASEPTASLGEELPSVPAHAPFSLNILVKVKTMQQQNGLRHQDYHRYRQYCSRRLHRIRKATKLTNGRERFKKCAIPDDFSLDKVLEIPLVSAERAWAYSAELLGVYAQFIEDKPALRSVHSIKGVAITSVQVPWNRQAAQSSKIRADPPGHVQGSLR